MTSVEPMAGVELLNAARAENARLTLELRSLQHRLETAERAPVQTDRSAWQRELEAARQNATDLVASASRRAEACVAAAHRDVLTALASAPAPTPPPALTTAPMARATTGPRPSLWSRLLHPDVLLPLIAVVAVLIVLLAWVG